MVALKTPLFKLGRVVATPGALEALEHAGQGPGEFLSFHAQGQWGIVDDVDRKSNDEAVKDGSRILSAYLLLTGQKIWIVTEAADGFGRRASTTISLPEE